MKLYAFLVFTSLWLIHIRVSNAVNAPGYGNTFRGQVVPGGPLPPFRRAHNPHFNKPPPGQFKKKWYPPHQSISHGGPGHNQRPRRPSPPPPGPQQQSQMSHLSGTYMRQRLGHGVPTQQPLIQHQLKQEVQTLQQHNQNLKLNKNVKTPSAPKWAFPSRNLKAQPQKPFLSSPKLNTEVEYHIQTNQIPNQSPVMIKQLDDEKGPIHTIPAPNLSLADKPKQVHLHQPKQQSPVLTQVSSQPQQPHLLQHFETTTLRVLKPQTHQYQVTESPDGEKILVQDADIPPLKPEIALPTDDVYGLLPVQDGYAYSVLHQPQLQQHILQQQQSNAFQTLLVQPQFFQPDPGFLETQHKQMATPPEMHTFNYVEPKHNRQSSQSQVTAEFVVQDGSEHQQDGGDLVEGFYTSVSGKDTGVDYEGHRPFEQVASATQAKEMMIYVPDDQDHYDPAEDPAQYEENDQSGKGKGFRYGSRIRPKKE